MLGVWHRSRHPRARRSVTGRFQVVGQRMSTSTGLRVSREDDQHSVLEPSYGLEWLVI
jgi:hypothetical protein